MAVDLNCTNKDCGKWMQPVLDVKTNKVYCTKCDGEMIASHFTKISLKTVGQVKKAGKGAYSIRCAACKTESMPKLANGVLCCQHCAAALTGISKPFENLIKEAIKNHKDDPDQD